MPILVHSPLHLHIYFHLHHCRRTTLHPHNPSPLRSCNYHRYHRRLPTMNRFWTIPSPYIPHTPRPCYCGRQVYATLRHVSTKGFDCQKVSIIPCCFYNESIDRVLMTINSINCFTIIHPNRLGSFCNINKIILNR
jgi:hypothetical protein